MTQWMKKYLALLALIGMTTAFAADAPVVQSEFVPSGYNSFKSGNTAKIYGKYVNYNEGGVWKKTELKPVDKGTHFEVSSAPFGIVAPKSSAGTFTFTDKHNYSPKTKTFRDDAPVSKDRVFTDVKNVAGVIEDAGVRYKGAFDTLGADLVLELDTDEARYLAEWKALPTPCSNPSATFEIPFTQTVGSLIPKKKNGSNIGGTDEEIGNGFSFSANDFRGIGSPQAKIWDSKGKSQNISIIAKFNGPFLRGKKVISCSFFKDVTYPVRTDDSDTFYPDPNAETTSVDGWVGSASAAPWDTAHDAATGTDAADSATPGYVGATVSPEAGTSRSIYRLVLLFDTSALPDTASISAATLGIYTEAKLNHDNDGKDYLTVVSSNPASNTALVTADYDLVGSAIDNPEKLSDDIDFGSLNTSAFNTWTLNVAGLAAISTTGVTKLGMREGHDQTDEDLALSTANQGNRAQVTMAESAATTSDPVLTVTYTEGAAAPTGAPIQMLIIGLIQKAFAAN